MTENQEDGVNVECKEKRKMKKGKKKRMKKQRRGVNERTREEDVVTKMKG